MKSLIKISVVSYLNTLPFRHALKNSEYINNHANISCDIPSECAKKLQNNTVDIGLIPVAAICDLDYYQILSNYCLSSGPEVFSVLLLSEKPIHEIKNIILDYHSRTSVQMIQILVKKHLKLRVNFLPGNPGFEHNISGDTAGLVIGDRAMAMRHKFNFVYDLAKIWLEYTHTYPVFALWVANKFIDKEFINNFNETLSTGIDKIEEIVKLYQSIYPTINLYEYFTQQIVFTLDENRKKSATYFYNEICNKKLLL
jgi:chorismate dehydratase